MNKLVIIIVLIRIAIIVYPLIEVVKYIRINGPGK